MPRLSDSILEGSFNIGHAPMLDAKYGGQFGYSPDLREWVSTTDYVSKNMVALLVEAPKGFKYFKNPPSWVATLRALVETHAITIDGLKSKLDVEVTETAVGGGGEMFHTPSNVKREQSAVSMTFKEKYGRPIQTFLNAYITGLIMDPDSKVPDIATFYGEKPDDLLADMYAFTMLFFEPDPLHQRISKAWLVCNMFPKTTGDINGKKDFQTAGENVEISIEFTGVTQTGYGVMAFAQTCLNNINFRDANPILRPAFIQSISPDVEGVSGRGYKQQAENLGLESVNKASIDRIRN